MASHRPSWLNPSMSFPCSSACTTHSRAMPKPIVCYGMSRVGFALVVYLLGRFPTQSSCFRGWIRYLQTHHRSPLGTRYTSIKFESREPRPLLRPPVFILPPRCGGGRAGVCRSLGTFRPVRSYTLPQRLNHTLIYFQISRKIWPTSGLQERVS